MGGGDLGFYGRTWKSLTNHEMSLVCTYNPNKNLTSNHLKEIDKNLDNYYSQYDKFILLGDFNLERTESNIVVVKSIDVKT